MNEDKLMKVVMWASAIIMITLAVLFVLLGVALIATMLGGLL